MPSSATSKSSDFYRPGGPDPATETPLDRFEAMNKWIMSKGGWVTSIPGDAIIAFEVLPDSSIPDELRAQGYDVEPALHPEGQRILPTAITTEVIIEKGAAPIRVTHAGIVMVERYSFSIP